MNEKISDSVFGEMSYKHSWTRIEAIEWWGVCNVQITAHAFTGQEIDERQRAAYLDYQKNIMSLLAGALPQLIEFVNRSCSSDSAISQQDLYNSLHPKTVLFQRDGSWGILFDSDWDAENGIGVFKVNSIVKVGTQDDFL